MKNILTLVLRVANSKIQFNLVLILLLIGITLTSCKTTVTIDSEESKTSFHDIYSDTWVATDAIGRTMPDINSVGEVKTDKKRVVGIFYITWHSAEFSKLKDPINYNITKIFREKP